MKPQPSGCRVYWQVWSNYRGRHDIGKHVGNSGVDNDNVDNWRDEYSYICVQRPQEQWISQEINEARHMNIRPSSYRRWLSHCLARTEESSNGGKEISWATIIHLNDLVYVEQRISQNER